jgi:hypothetical protein
MSLWWKSDKGSDSSVTSASLPVMIAAVLLIALVAMVVWAIRH